MRSGRRATSKRLYIIARSGPMYGIRIINMNIIVVIATANIINRSATNIFPLYPFVWIIDFFKASVAGMSGSVSIIYGTKRYE